MIYNIRGYSAYFKSHTGGNIMTEETKREGIDYEGGEPFFTVYEVDGDSRKLVFHSLELK